ncbi:serine protease [uncultured Paraglaciecola sp.]|uniref:trypsin-like serine peptidase n=1 Tax=uncultured Paraglaciecola sp. TaxID=1765024 RepID=UPI0026355C3C|nr:serine protease [uncultured Paraglaciecola sp.]
MSIKYSLVAYFVTCFTVISHANELTISDNYPSASFIVPPTESKIDTSNSIQKVIGTKDFEKVRSYSSNSDVYQLSKKVGAVFINGRAACTGSLVGPDLFLTNEHCAFSSGEAIPLNKYLFSFNYYLDDLQTVTQHPLLKATKLLKYNAKLDYALYQLSAPIGNQLGWLKIEKNDNLLNSSRNVRIIQHPKGRSKEITTKNAQLYKKHMNKGVVHYFADTEPGSSGSPVFSANGETLIALHHAGYNDKKGNGLINEGILASQIYSEINSYLPQQNARKAQPKKARTPTKPTPQPQPKMDKPKKVPAPKPPSPAKPKNSDCNGNGMKINKEDGKTECVRW